jgi:hypothetical protein
LLAATVHRIDQLDERVNDGKLVRRREKGVDLGRSTPSSRSLSLPAEEDQVAVGVSNDELLCTPGLIPRLRR